ncbi:hypothetical protein D0Z08_19605 [Nocardioides immobilis]|uniref:Uncharacterized protein n=1 Tax=Nocardioides immobilis TaxID=2049295 RepID=A0A417XYJ9_9ACTN|nr:hypothetical protein D0Z08_19605 [Nocardioides immobilis]
MTLTPALRAAAVEALQAAWESTDPWSASEALRIKAEDWLARVLRDGGIPDAEVQVIVIDDLPYRVPT